MHRLTESDGAPKHGRPGLSEIDDEHEDQYDIKISNDHTVVAAVLVR